MFNLRSKAGLGGCDESLVFYPMFMDLYGVCILCGDCVDLFRFVFKFYDMELKFSFQTFHDGMCVVAHTLATKTMIGVTVYRLL